MVEALREEARQKMGSILSYISKFYLLLQINLKKMEELIKELRRCEILEADQKYNGITLRQGVEAYRLKIEAMYSDCLVFVLSNKPVNIEAILNDIRLTQKDFDVPSVEYIASYKEDFIRYGTDSLRRAYEFGQFVRDCVDVQAEYLQRLYSLFGIDAPNEVANQHIEGSDEAVEEPPTSDVTSPTYVKGVRGLAQELHCGTNKAQGILNNGILQQKGVAWHIGRTWNINVKKLKQLLQDEPSLLANVPAYRGRVTNNN